MTTPEDARTELKPCPFCGEPPKMKKPPSNKKSVRQVSCRSDLCSVCPDTFGETPERATEKWNTRATIPKAKLSDVQADARMKAMAAPWVASSYEGGWDCIRDANGQIVAKLGLNIPEHATLIAQAWTIPALKSALGASNKALIAERDCLYDSITDENGALVAPHDGEGLAELDALIDANRAALNPPTEGESQ